MELDDEKFPHGKHAGYKYGCRRPCCREPELARSRRNYKPKAPERSRGRRTPAAVAVAVLGRLRAQGLTWGDIGKMCGMDPAYLRRVHAGRMEYLFAETVERIVLAERSRAPRPGFLDSAVCRQMVGSLMALGYPRLWITRELGFVHGSATRFITPTVTRASYEAVKALYDRIGDTPGPDPRARVFARKAGWWPPAYYDEDGTLAVDALPAPVSPEEEAAERVLDVLRLALAGASRQDTAAKVGVDEQTVGRYRRLAGLRMEYQRDLEQSTVAAECRDRAREIREVLADYDTPPTPTAVEMLTRLGIHPPVPGQNKPKKESDAA